MRTKVQHLIKHDLPRALRLFFLLSLFVSVLGTLAQLVKQHAGGPGIGMSAALLLTVVALRVVEFRRDRPVPVWCDVLEMVAVVAVMSQMSVVYPIISTIFSTVLFRAAVGPLPRLVTALGAHLTAWFAAAALFPQIEVVIGAAVSLPITSMLVFSTRVLMLRLQEQQRAQSALLDAVLRRLPFPVVVTDATSNVVLANAAAKELVGRAEAEDVTLDGLSLTDAEERPVDLTTLIARGPVELQMRLRRGDGDERQVQMRTVPMDGFTVVALLDVTAQWAYERHLHRAAYYDMLTGLPNRRLLWERLTLAFSAGTPYTMMLIDLNDFKTVNDTHGHKVGDELLTAVAQRLSDACDESAVVARLGGDEFAILLPDTSPAHAETAAEAVRASFTEPFDLSCGRLAGRGTVGIATARPGQSPDDVIAAADAAMYLAKPAAKRRTRGQDSARRAATAS